MMKISVTIQGREYVFQSLSSVRYWASVPTQGYNSVLDEQVIAAREIMRQIESL